MLLDNQWVREEIIGELENNLRQMTIKKQHIKTCEMQQSSAKREIYRYIYIYFKSQVNNLTLHLKN